MYPPFLPSPVGRLCEPEAVQLAQSLQRTAIATPLISEPIQTCFTVQGQGGADILLIHGFDSSVLEYRYLLPRLALGYRVWAVDLLGFGFTERPQGIPYDPEAIRTHLHRFWQAQINRPVIVIGASMGGAVALDFAETHPDAVSKIVLIDTAGLAPKPLSRFVMVPPLDRWATKFLGSQAVRRKICEQAYFDKSRVSDDAVICGALHLGCDRWAEALIAFTKGGGYGSFYPKLRSISQPALILWGEQDKILGTKDAHRFVEGLPHSQLHWIPCSGHLPHVEQPDLVAKQIQAFTQAATSTVSYTKS